MFAAMKVRVVVDAVRGPWAICAPGGRGPRSGSSDPDPGA